MNNNVQAKGTPPGQSVESKLRSNENFLKCLESLPLFSAILYSYIELDFHKILISLKTGIHILKFASMNKKF